VLAELAAGAAGTAVLLHALRHALFPPVTRTFGHDLIFWYPVWQLYAEGLSRGELWLWNPFSYGGLALYPALMQLRAFDPISFLVIVVGQVFTPDLLARYNWDVFLRALLPAVTTHVFLRRFAREPVTRVALLLSALGSSSLLVLLRVHGAGQGFLWAPLIGILLYRLLWLGDGRWRIVISLAAFLGLNWQSYFIASHGLFAVLLALGLFWCGPARVRRVLAVPRLGPKVAVAALLLAVMAAPLAVVVREGDEVLYLTRLMDTGRPPDKVGPIQYEPAPSPTTHEVGVLMPHEFFLRAGTPSTVWNFLQLVTPTGNWYREGGHGWGNPSEAFMYLGLPVYAVALFGAFTVRHPLRRAWLLILGVFGLLMLGPLGGVQSFLSIVFPPVRLTRHTHTYTPYFQLALLFFFVLGADRLIALHRGLPHPGRSAPVEEAASPRWLTRLGAVIGAIFLVYLAAYETPAALRVFPPGKAVTPLAVALGLLGLWLLSRRWSPMRLFWACLLGHLVAVPVCLSAAVLSGLHASPAGGLTLTLGKIGLYWVIFLALPVSLYAIGGRVKGRWHDAVLPILLILLAGDLLFYVTYTSYLWNWPRPDRLLGVSSHVTRPTPPATRGLYPAEAERTAVLGQVIRYPEILLRAPYLLTAPRGAVLADGSDTAPERVSANLEALRGMPRWNSFYVPRPYWSLLQSGTPAPVLVRLWALGEPIVRLVSAYTVVADRDFPAFFRSMSPAEGRCVLGELAVLPESSPGLEESGVPRLPGSAPPGGCVASDVSDATFKTVDYAPGRMTLQVTTGRPRILVVSETTHPRWAARVDGRPVALLRANYLAKAVLVPAGSHQVELRFDPGILLPALSVFTLVGVGVLAGTAAAGLAGLLRVVAGWAPEKR
jgi:hypothetical protein